MKKLIFYLLLSVLNIHLFAAERIEMFSQCRYIENYDKNLSIEDIKKLPEDNWKSTSKSFINFSYRPDLEVWLKCSYKNDSQLYQKKILELDWPHIGYATLFGDYISKQGTLLLGKNHLNFTPRFELHFAPKEEKEFYIYTSSPVSSLIIKPILWEDGAFDRHEIVRFTVLSLFFGALLALLIYNFFIYFFTKDRTYLWYCAYLLGVLLHQAYYTGFLEFFILQKPIEHRIYIHFIIAVSLMFIPPFTRTFLETKKYMPKADKILKIMPFYIALSSLVSDAKVMLVLLIPLSLVFLAIIFLALKKNVTQARYFAFGWLCVVTSMALMGLYNLGYLEFLSSFPYLVQAGIAVEALIFSIGLADRINRLKAEKAAADALLIKLQKDEKNRLEKMVKERTKQLLKALDEKDILFKELNHRVKNNMQMIISLLRLQSNKIVDENAKEILKTAQNRIGSISKLHELLYKKNEVSKIDTKNYFVSIVNEILKSFPNSKNIEVVFDINADLNMTKAIYCGLIVNELVTNSIKHAFGKNGGKIEISLYKDNDKHIFLVKDNGKGFDPSKKSNSLGLLLVKTLSSMQLKGDFFIDSENGKSLFKIIF